MRTRKCAKCGKIIGYTFEEKYHLTIYCPECWHELMKPQTLDWMNLGPNA